MNEFEKARQKAAKSMERRDRQTLHLSKPVEPQVVEPINGAERFEPVPKEKQHHGVVSVRIHLPNETMEFTFTKDQVMENVPRNLLKREVIQNALREGLRPIFGAVK